MGLLWSTPISRWSRGRGALDSGATMPLKENSPPQELVLDGLDARGWISHTTEIVPTIEHTIPLRQALSHNPLWRHPLGRGRFYDSGSPSIEWQYRGARADCQGARQAGCLARWGREGASQVAASRGCLSPSRGPFNNRPAPYRLSGKKAKEMGASPRLPSSHPLHQAEIQRTV